MTGLEIKDVGGTISDFEHYRLDPTAIPTVAAVPEASTWMMFLLGFARDRRHRKRMLHVVAMASDAFRVA